MSEPPRQAGMDEPPETGEPPPRAGMDEPPPGAGEPPPGTAAQPPHTAARPQGRLPPVTQVGMLSLALIVAGGIYLSAHLPEHVSLAPAVALLCASALLLAGNLAALARVERFAWGRFLEVAGWALLAYAIIAGMIEYVFLRNHTSGGPLVVLTLSLVVFAVHVPVLIGFTVARFQESEASG